MIFGHGGCFGQKDYCSIREAYRPGDTRSFHPLTPISKAINITKALKQRKDLRASFQFTLVACPIIYDPPDDGEIYLPTFIKNYTDLLQFDKIRIVTYD